MARIRNQKFIPNNSEMNSNFITSHLTGCPPISSLFYSTIFLTSGNLCEMDGMIGWAVMDRTMLIACFLRLKTLWMLNLLCGGQTLRQLHDPNLLVFMLLYYLFPLCVDANCHLFITSRIQQRWWVIIPVIILLYTLCLVNGLVLTLPLA